MRYLIVSFTGLVLIWLTGVVANLSIIFIPNDVTIYFVLLFLIILVQSYKQFNLSKNFLIVLLFISGILFGILYADNFWIYPIVFLVTNYLYQYFFKNPESLDIIDIVSKSFLFVGSFELFITISQIILSPIIWEINSIWVEVTWSSIFNGIVLLIFYFILKKDDTLSNE